MSVKCYLLFAALIGVTCAQSELPSFPENMTLPPELQGKVDEKQLKELGNTYLDKIKQKCEDNGGPEAFQKAQNAHTNATKCVQSLVDPEVLQREIEEAKPHGSVDEVFKKYCQKKPSFKGCFNSYLDAASGCVAEKERKNFKTVTEIIDQLVEFICYKDGDRIALFIAEGGEECFREKQPDLENCMNSTFGPDVSISPQNFSSDSIPALTFDEKQCGKLTQLQTCVVGALDTCSKPTSANIVESLFKFIRKSTPCKAFEDAETKAQKGNSATASLFSTSLLVLGLSAVLYF